MASDDKKLILGIDIGTTSVKVCVIDPVTEKVLSKQSKDTQANVPSDLGCEGNKQDVPKIISALNFCVSRLPKDLLREVEHIGICGQMHGVLLWANREGERAWENIELGSGYRFEVNSQRVSALYTWQDSRCDTSFLSTLPEPKSYLQVYSGYGSATLFWISKYRPAKLEKFNCAGTIQDFAVSILCNLQKPVMSVQNAAMWGYFDTVDNSWNVEILQENNFPVHLLPTIVKTGETAGKLSHCWYGIPSGTSVGAALGDLPCSVLATLEEPTDAVLNISTSAQLAFIMPSGFQPKQETSESLVLYFPYFEDRYLAVAAALNGGNALATFVSTVQQWTLELGFNLPQSKLWEKLLSLGMEANATSSLKVVPTILGERHIPEQNASVSNIDLGNLKLGQVFRALCSGVIENVHSMMSREVLVESNIKRILGVGSALTRNKVLQAEVHRWYQLPVEFVTGGDAAKGAALAVCRK